MNTLALDKNLSTFSFFNKIKIESNRMPAWLPIIFDIIGLSRIGIDSKFSVRIIHFAILPSFVMQFFGWEEVELINNPNQRKEIVWINKNSLGYFSKNFFNKDLDSWNSIQEVFDQFVSKSLDVINSKKIIKGYKNKIVPFTEFVLNSNTNVSLISKDIIILYDKNNTLGKGVSKTVYRAHMYFLKTKKVKRVAYATEIDFESKISNDNLRKECQIIRKFNSDKIIKLHFFSNSAGKSGIKMVLDLYETDLSKEIRNLTHKGKLKAVKNICIGVEEIHDKDYVHRDLKPHNFLLDHKNEPVITDFGATVRKGERKISGTSLFMAPEVWKNDPASSENDVWSMGINLILLFCRRPLTILQPIVDKMQDLQFQAVFNKGGIDPNLIKQVHIDYEALDKEVMDDRIKSMIKKCLKENKKERGKIKEIKNLFSSLLREENERSLAS